MVIPCLNFNKQLTAKVEKFDLSYGFKLPTYILLNVCKYFPFPVPLSRLGRMELCYDSWLYCMYMLCIGDPCIIFREYIYSCEQAVEASCVVYIFEYLHHSELFVLAKVKYPKFRL